MRSGETRDRLIRAAVTSFATQGYASTALNDVVERAGLTTGAVYSTFGSKEELFVNAAAFVEGRIEQVVALGQRPHFSLEERVGAFIDSVVQLAETDPDTLVFRTVVSVEVRRHPELRAAIGDEFGRRLDLCRRVIGLVGETGLELTTEELAKLMLLAAEGLTTSVAGWAPNPFPQHREEAELWKQLIFGDLLAVAG